MWSRGQVEVQIDMQQAYMTIRLTKVSGTYLKPSQTSMVTGFFCGKN